MTERLTERVGDGIRYDNGNYTVTCYPKNNNLTPVDKLAAKLCDLENKIENGAVIALPCKVGDTVYADICDAKDGDFCDECIVKSVEIDKDSPEPLYTVVCYARAEYRTYWASDFLKEFFKEPRFSEKRTGNRKRRGGNR
jgi:hypothetical protein